MKSELIQSLIHQVSIVNSYNFLAQVPSPSFIKNFVVFICLIAMVPNILA